MTSIKQRRRPREESKVSSKELGVKGLSTSKTIPSSIGGQYKRFVSIGLVPSFRQDILRCRSVWFAAVVLLLVTGAVYGGFLSILSTFIRETTSTLGSDGRPFEVVDLPGKGKGVVALRDIKVFMIPFA